VGPAREAAARGRPGSESRLGAAEFGCRVRCGRALVRRRGVGRPGPQV